jgi:CubicO group peptidase (beta-lactamase class C family)
MKKITCVFTLILAFQSLIFAQNVQPVLADTGAESVGMSTERMLLLDELIQKFINEGNLPGGVFTIARKGKVVYYKNFGYRTLDKIRPYKKDDIFRLASMTKAFTTVSIMQLFEKGKLGLDDPIYYYIPTFKNTLVLDQFNNADSTYTTNKVKKPITIRHLLTHTSGISYGSFNPGKINAIYTKAGISNFGLSDKVLTTKEMVDKIAGVPLIFQPGDKFMYGLNMEVLGRIVEVVSGKPLNEYFKANIFDPLNMNDTYFYLPKSKQDRLVPVYTYNSKNKMTMSEDTDYSTLFDYPKNEDNNHYAGGGGASGTAMDYTKFILALVNNGVYNGKRILSRNTIDVMTADQLILLNMRGKGYSKVPGITFGLGFALKTEQGIAVSPKSSCTYEWGGVFNTKFFIDPEEELVFVGLTQIVPFKRPDFWNKLYAILYGALDD